MAVAAFLSARFVSTYPAPLISTVLTLTVAVAVVTHKTFARARKLCTQTHIDVLNLLRDMDRLDEVRGRSGTTSKARARRPAGRRRAADHAAEVLAVRKSWDVLELDLRTTVDTGYRWFGLPFLAKDTVESLVGKVSAGIRSAELAASIPARNGLHAILSACEAHIDVLA
ncbi:hypothetical protein [Streptomyces sp. NBC_01369]|uniref:hypothetical protein n=1 Tax=Streptomyces sp. NBC_01369 TaxID=2903842 RepID=UPI003D80AC5D